MSKGGLQAEPDGTRVMAIDNFRHRLLGESGEINKKEFVILEFPDGERWVRKFNLNVVGKCRRGSDRVTINQAMKIEVFHHGLKMAFPEEICGGSGTDKDHVDHESDRNWISGLHGSNCQRRSVRKLGF